MDERTEELEVPIYSIRLWKCSNGVVASVEEGGEDYTKVSDRIIISDMTKVGETIQAEIVAKRLTREAARTRSRR